MTPAFWIDYGYDADHASDGASRYGAYVRMAADTVFAECWDGTWDSPAHRAARFAAAAWQTATGPVMAPGYIRMHPRVLSARTEVNGWDGSLTGAVTLAAPWPAPLARSGDWRGGQRWQDWPLQHTLGGPAFYREPGEDELTRGRYLLAKARLLFPLAAGALPAAPDGPRDALEAKARTAAEALVSAMNTAVAPVLDALERCVMTKLCILAAALAVIARARVAVLPGWVVPLPALILIAELTACAAFVAWLVHQARRPAAPPDPAGGAA